MSAVVFGLIAGFVFGGLAVLVMLPMQFDDARRAYVAAFFSRFSIGFLVPLVALPLPMWVVGAMVGFLVSLSDAVVSRAYVPVMVMGTVGGAIIGLIGDWVLI